MFPVIKDVRRVCEHDVLYYYFQCVCVCVCLCVCVGVSVCVCVYEYVCTWCSFGHSGLVYRVSCTAIKTVTACLTLHYGGTGSEMQHINRIHTQHHVCRTAGCD